MARKDKERNTWMGEIRYYDSQGKRRLKKKRGFRTKKEALEWEEAERGKIAPDADMFLEDFVEVYISDKKGYLKERTLKAKVHMIRTHIIPFFAGKKMTEITVHDVLQWQQEMMKKDLSESYLRNVNNQISGIFRHAVLVYDLKGNPCTKIKKLGKTDVKRLVFWEKEEFDKFLATMEPGTQYYLLFEVLFWSGMRLGECLALTPEDIDYVNGVIHISKTYFRMDGEDVVTSPKTEESNRDVIVPESLLTELKEYIGKHYEMPKTARIFPVVHEAVQHKMKRQIEASGVSFIPVHSLRHSCCAYLISQGVDPMIIKKQLGHKDIKITLNTYGHLYKKDEDDLKKLLSSLKKSPENGNSQNSNS